MDQLLTDNVWGQVATLSKSGDKKIAAIAYVTSDTHLSFQTNDVLVCDASDNAIKSGETSARTLKRFFDAGARLFCCRGLHAKAFIAGDLAVVGSSNLSGSSATNLIEASFVTRRFQARSQVRAFVQKLIPISTLIDSAFIARALKLPVTVRKLEGSIRRRSIEPPTNRTWLVSTTPLSERIQETEAEFEETGETVARDRMSNPEGDLSWIRWVGKSKFRSTAQEEDSVIELERNKAKTRCNVVEPRAILLRQDHERWTRFYLEDPPKVSCLPWGRFAAELGQLGIGRIKTHTTRELSPKEVSLMESIWIDQ